MSCNRLPQSTAAIFRDQRVIKITLMTLQVCNSKWGWKAGTQHFFVLLLTFWLIVGLNLTTEAGDILRAGMVAARRPRVRLELLAQPLVIFGREPEVTRWREQHRPFRRSRRCRRRPAIWRAMDRPTWGSTQIIPARRYPMSQMVLCLADYRSLLECLVDLAHPTTDEDPSLWTGATLPAQSVENGLTDVNIKQTAQQALLNWQTFNVGKDTTVTFDQSAGGANASQWIAFNTINDPLGVPSQILGSINALGQIYLINQNGIIFGGASQVNLHSLVASSLPMNINLVERGLLNNPDDQFLFSALAIPILPNGGTMPAFNPPPPPNTPGGTIRRCHRAGRCDTVEPDDPGSCGRPYRVGWA